MVERKVRAGPGPDLQEAAAPAGEQILAERVQTRLLVRPREPVVGSREDRRPKTHGGRLLLEEVADRSRDELRLTEGDVVV